MATFSTWSTPAQLTLRSTQSSPAIANNGGRLCMAWKDGNNNIMVSISDNDGLSWSPRIEPRVQNDPAGWTTENTPALTAGDGQFMMAWRVDQQIFFSLSTDGFDWSDSAVVNHVTTQNGPALAAGTDKFVMAWRDFENKISISLKEYNDGRWMTGSGPVIDEAVQSGPALAAGDGKFMMAWTNPAGQIQVWESSNGGEWSVSSGQPNNAVTAAAPAMTYINRGNEHVWCLAWKDDSNNIKAFYSDDNGLNWKDAIPPTGISTQNGPALSPAGSKLYMIWQDLQTHITVSYARINYSNPIVPPTPTPTPTN